MAELAVTAIGPDGPGIVAAVAGVLHERGGNVLDSAMTILGGRFSLALLVETSDDAPDLAAALREATSSLGLHVTVDEAGDATEQTHPTHLLSVYGQDHPGILAGVSATLADLGANITDLSTRMLGGGDEPVYAMVVEVVAGDEAGLRAAMAATAARLEVDWTLRQVDDVTY